MRAGIENIFADAPRLVPLNASDIRAYLDRLIRYWAEKHRRAPLRSRFRLVAAVRLNAYQSVRQNLFGERLAIGVDQEEMELGK